MKPEARDALQSGEKKDDAEHNASAVAESSSPKQKDREPQFATETGSYRFSLTGYSLMKGMGTGEHISSGNFTVGGHEWAVYFYPGGKYAGDGDQSFVSVYIALVSESSNVQAIFEITLVDQSEAGKHRIHSHFNRELDEPITLKYRGYMWGYRRFFRREGLESSAYLKDDTLEFTGRVGVLLASVKSTNLKTSPGSTLSLKQEDRNDAQDDSSPQHSTHDSTKLTAPRSGSPFSSDFEVRRMEDEVARYHHKLAGNKLAGNVSLLSVDESPEPKKVPSDK